MEGLIYFLSPCTHIIKLLGSVYSSFSICYPCFPNQKIGRFSDQEDSVLLFSASHLWEEPNMLWLTIPDAYKVLKMMSYVEMFYPMKFDMVGMALILESDILPLQFTNYSIYSSGFLFDSCKINKILLHCEECYKRMGLLRKWVSHIQNRLW